VEQAALPLRRRHQGRRRREEESLPPGCPGAVQSVKAPRSTVAAAGAPTRLSEARPPKVNAPGLSHGKRLLHVAARLPLFPQKRQAKSQFLLRPFRSVPASGQFSSKLILTLPIQPSPFSPVDSNKRQPLPRQRKLQSNQSILDKFPSWRGHQLQLSSGLNLFLLGRSQRLRRPHFLPFAV
jgi:hypothetical protein